MSTIAPVMAPPTAGTLISDFSAVKALVEGWEEVDAKVPHPAGYRILVAMPQMKRKTASGIYLPEVMTSREEVASLVAMVIEVGTDAYKDPKRFPSGPLCEPGDFVIVRSYSGTRMKFRDVEFRFVNDDSVEGVVADPTEIQRA